MFDDFCHSCREVPKGGLRQSEQVHGQMRWTYANEGCNLSFLRYEFAPGFQSGGVCELLPHMHEKCDEWDMEHEVYQQWSDSG